MTFCKMCKTPKILYIKSQTSDKSFKLVVPCGHCVDCLNSKRAQLVARFRNEKEYIKNVYFVTLTYTDANLLDLYYKPYYLKYKLRNDMLKELAARKLTKNTGLYSDFLLNKDHARNFIKSITKFLNTNFQRVKWYLNGEYGCLNNRPHLHCAFFSPYYFTLNEFKSIVERFWLFGDVDVGFCTDAGFNYLAKHCVKDDSGSELQQKLSPIFSMQSKYHGGIGINLRKDKHILSNYFNNLKYGTIPNTPYKYALPRYVLKYLHPEKFTDSELKEFEIQGLQNLSEKVDCSRYGSDFNTRIPECTEQFRSYIRNGAKESFLIQKKFKLTKFNKKKLLNSYKRHIFDNNLNN